MTMTFAQIADAVTLELNGFTQSIEQAATLTGAIDASATSIPVSDASQFSRGLIEVEDELIYVESVDTQNNTLTVPAWGRGQSATTAASHASGVKAINAPTFPRGAIKRAVNETIQAVYPTLWGVDSTTVTIIAGVQGYTVPADVKDVLQLTWADPVTEEDVPIRRWRFDPYASKLSIYDAIAPGRTVTVRYRKAPTSLSLDADVYTTVTGLPLSSLDVIRLGAVVRLLPYLEATNSSTLTAEADFSANSRVTSTSANALSRSLIQVYQLRLAEEGMKLVQAMPVRIHYTI